MRETLCLAFIRLYCQYGKGLKLLSKCRPSSLGPYFQPDFKFHQDRIVRFEVKARC